MNQVELVVKNLPSIARDKRGSSSIRELGRSHGGGHGNLLQYSCLDNPMDRGAWWTIVHEVAKESNMTESAHTHMTCKFLVVCG